jgi:hypothetical protein
VAFAKAYFGLIDRITEVESEPPRRALLRAKVRVSPLIDG